MVPQGWPPHGPALAIVVAGHGRSPHGLAGAVLQGCVPHAPVTGAVPHGCAPQGPSFVATVPHGCAPHGPSFGAGAGHAGGHAWAAATTG